MQSRKQAVNRRSVISMTSISPGCCCFQAEAPNYGCGIFTDTSSIREAVEDLSCTNPAVIDEYNNLQNQEE